MYVCMYVCMYVYMVCMYIWYVCMNVIYSMIQLGILFSPVKSSKMEHFVFKCNKEDYLSGIPFSPRMYCVVSVRNRAHIHTYIHTYIQCCAVA